MGGALGNRAANAVARLIREADVAIAGILDASTKGNIAASKISLDGLPVRIGGADLSLLKQLDTLPSSAAGALREYVTDNYFLRNGYTKLEGKCGAGNCFDGVYVKGNTIIVNEVKPLSANGSIKLSGNSGTSLGTQMSDQWIEGAIRRLDESGDTNATATAKLLQDAFEKKTLVKVVSGVDRHGVTLFRLP